MTLITAKFVKKGFITSRIYFIFLDNVVKKT